MSTSKKPGTDLAALKARLAKKTKGKAPDPPPAEPPPAAVQQPPPAAPAQAMQPPEPVAYQEPVPDLPPPGQSMPQQAAPQQYAQPPAAEPMGGIGHAAPAVAPPTDDPFGGGAGSFDPADGVIVDTGGEVQSKGSIGLLIFAGLLGAAFGAAAGFLGHKMVENKERKGKGEAKGVQMVEAVAGVISARQDVSLKMEELEKKMQTDPKGAADDIEALLSDKWENQVKVNQLFGWQLAAVHGKGVKRTFELFEEASRVKKDLQYLQAFLASQPEALLKGNGPSQFAVMFKSNGGKLVAALEPLCAGETPEAAPKPCADSERGKAVAYRVIDKIGSDPIVVPRGAAEGQATLLLNDGGVYGYAVGLEPNRNAVIYRNGLLQRVKDHLEAMAKVEKFAEKALKNYADNPNVDGSVEQPDPEAGGGEGG